MPTPFPGMDPYLERRGLWREIHTNLISAIQGFLSPLLRPKYRIAIEQYTHLSLASMTYKRSGQPDVMVTMRKPKIGQPSGGVSPVAVAEATSNGHWVADSPLLGELPMPEEIVERYLEIRDVITKEVITVIEILSPTNKEDKFERQEYEQKRLKILGSSTSLVEIDLLRAGKPFAMKVYGQKEEKKSDYRIVVSRSWQRPHADLYLFSVRQPIPSFLIPLRYGEKEPVLPLNQILHDLYDQRSYDMEVDYSQPAIPPLSKADAAWKKGDP